MELIDQISVIYSPSNSLLSKDIVNIQEAASLASDYLKKNVSTANISYLIQYGKIKKYIEDGKVAIDKSELLNYYNSVGNREADWKSKLGDDLNWSLSFDNIKESETTKHVHRLHPYKGKYIPQLVEYFLDSHTDNFKKNIYFHPGDIVLDPFAGSGTTLVEANELGMHSIGIDISAFNALIANCKLMRYDFDDLKHEIHRITNLLKSFVADSKILVFDNELTELLSQYNKKHFTSPEYKRKVYTKEINPKTYGTEHEKAFLPIYNELLEKYHIQLQQPHADTFLSKWFIKHVRDEIELIYNAIQDVKNVSTKKILYVILSRTIRSCRATTHQDLGTLIEPTFIPYYCRKHYKICKPLFSMLKWWEKYTFDTLNRLKIFDGLRTPTHQYCIAGDSRVVDIFSTVNRIDEEFGKILTRQKIKGIFSSPPYVGLIDYHEQHAYAYELFGFTRNDNSEIGPLFKGQKLEARHSYVEGISSVLNNCKKYLVDDYDVFLVANDKYNLYPEIAEKAGMIIVNQFKRPVLNRTEKDKNAFAEIIFHLKDKKHEFG